MIQTAERVSHRDLSDNYVYQRSILAYLETATIISGKVLEIGTGSGYGISTVAPKSSDFVTIDKFADPKVKEENAHLQNVQFLQMTIPPITGIADNTFDFVISFQVIEHIQNDKEYVKEIHRVLKLGGKFIVTTPNKPMSLSRNPWHIREYTIQELQTLLMKSFSSVETNGTYGNEKVMEYYYKNKESVNRIMKYDVLQLQWRLPRQLLQIPFDILNRMNRNKMLNADNTLVSSIHHSDFFVAPAKEDCLDLFFISTK